MRSREPYMLNLNTEPPDNDWDKKSHDALLTAILERAFRDAMGTTCLEKHIVREARQWIHSPLEDEWSFNWIAKELPLSSKAVKLIRQEIPEYSALRTLLPDNVAVTPALMQAIMTIQKRTQIFSRKVFVSANQHPYYRRKRL